MSAERTGAVLVTGGSGEIGSYLVAHFNARGWRVASVDKAEAPPADGVASAICDLGDGAAAAVTVEDLVNRCGGIDVLINCAGRIANAPLVRLEEGRWVVHDFALWSDVIASGLTSAFHATAICVRHFVASRKKGVVINVSSVCANGNPGQAAYSAAKAGLNGLTLALAKELGPLGIRVVGIAPGYFDTRSTTRNVSEGRLAKVTALVPLKRLGTVDELADAIDFIIRNEYMNGTIVELDGGLVV